MRVEVLEKQLLLRIVDAIIVGCVILRTVPDNIEQVPHVAELVILDPMQGTLITFGDRDEDEVLLGYGFFDLTFDFLPDMVLHCLEHRQITSDVVRVQNEKHNGNCSLHRDVAVVGTTSRQRLNVKITEICS